MHIVDATTLYSAINKSRNDVVTERYCFDFFLIFTRTMSKTSI
ncbi:hypothetical protein KGI01_21040 [Kurthia gibsonii]|nr:hypothetical protein KGI01_21040 [Kurthia gibsonii]